MTEQLEETTHIPEVKVTADKDGTLHYFVILPDVGNVELRKIKPFLFQRFNQTLQMVGKPRPPMHEVKIGNHSSAQPNSNDDWFKAEYAAWEESNALKINDYLLINGVITGPPDDFVVSTAFAGSHNLSGEHGRFLAWIYSMDDQNIIDLLQAVGELIAPDESEIWSTIEEFKSTG